MNRFGNNRMSARVRLLLAVGAGVLFTVPGSAQLQDAPALFTEARGGTVADAGDAATIRSRLVTVHTELLAAGGQRVTLAPFAGAVFSAIPDRVEVARPGQYVWRGTLAGVEDGAVTVSVTDGVAVGSITMPGAQYRIRYAGGGVHVVDEVDTTRMLREHEPIVPNLTDPIAPDPIPRAVPDNGRVIDVLVVYTPTARDQAGGSAAMSSVVNLAISNTNTAYANSGVTQRIRLVYSGEIGYTESGDMGDDLDNLRSTGDGFMDDVHRLRDTYRADFVALLKGYDQFYCGVGYLMRTVSTSFAPFAFSVSAWDCAMDYTLAHELGHNMGLHHDLHNAEDQGAYPYAYGYQDPGHFRTVMAYPCSGGATCPRIPYFSTPTRTYGGRPVGVANASENARALNNTAPTTANFRQSLGGSPDVDLDGRAELTVYRPSSGEWFVRKSSSGYSYADTLSLQWGVPGDRPVAADFDGDGAMDLTVYRPSSGQWFIRYSSRGYSYQSDTFQWGVQGDVPLANDFDGDARADLGIYRPSTGMWLIRLSSRSYSYAYVEYQWGQPNDQPIPADFDGDGRCDLAVYRPTTGEWHVRFSASDYWYATVATYGWGGVSGDKPLLGDFDGDARADLVVFRPGEGNWYIRYSSSAYSFANWSTYQWGVPGDTPLCADFDGDGRTDLVIYRPSSGEWFIRYSSTAYSYAYATYQWGIAGDVPIAPSVR